MIKYYIKRYCNQKMTVYLSERIAKVTLICKRQMIEYKHICRLTQIHIESEEKKWKIEPAF